MRILRVIPTVNPAYGGPLEGLKQSTAILDALGHKTHVASLDLPSNSWVINSQLNVFALGSKSSSYGYSRKFTTWLKVNRLCYDVIIVHGVWHYAAVGTWRALLGTDSKYFLFTHGMLDPWFKHQHPWKHIKKLLYWKLFEHRVVRDAKATLFTCEEERRLARLSFSPYKANEVVVSYGTSLPSGPAEEQISSFFADFPQLLNRRIILFLGRIHPKKGCDLLIEAFAKQCTSDETLHLVMAGPDQTGWKDTLQSRAEHLGIANRITWTGLLQGDRKWGVLRAAEIFVLPSHQENFGIAVSEALAAGCPVAISDKVNIWREIADDGAGIVDSDNLEGVENILRTWLEMPPEQKLAMRLQAKQCFENRFEIKAVVNSLLKAISS